MQIACRPASAAARSAISFREGRTSFRRLSPDLMVAQINPPKSRTSERVPAQPRTRSQLWPIGSGCAPARVIEVRRRYPGEQTRVTSESRRRQLPERPSVNAVLLHLEVQGLVVGLKAWRTRRIAREPESPGHKRN